jgi:hypothetical protein
MNGGGGAPAVAALMVLKTERKVVVADVFPLLCFVLFLIFYLIVVVKS